MRKILQSLHMIQTRAEGPMAQREATLTLAHHDYQKALIHYALFKLHDNAIGEDLVQDTFTKTWSYLVKGGRIVAMRSFLYHILNALIVDQYRKHPPVSLDLLIEKGFEPGTKRPANLMDILDGKAALLLIQRLPIPYQKIMRMRYVQDLSLSEMALATGQTKNALAVKAHRGLEKLKALFPVD